MEGIRIAERCQLNGQGADSSLSVLNITGHSFLTFANTCFCIDHKLYLALNGRTCLISSTKADTEGRTLQLQSVTFKFSLSCICRISCIRIAQSTGIHGKASELSAAL